MIEADSNLLAADKVRKHFGHFPALRGVSLRVNRGEFISIVGPNGAGKSTLLNCMATLQRPSSGTIRFEGQDLFEQGDDLRHRIGLMSHSLFLYGELSGLENLIFYARLYGLESPFDHCMMQLKKLGLHAARNRAVRTYSRGMKQRLAIARVLLHDPDLFLLDEPFTGLDQHAGIELRDLLGHLKIEGKTIIMISHHLDRAWELSTRIISLVQGKIQNETIVASADETTFRERYLELVSRQVEKS